MVLDFDLAGEAVVTDDVDDSVLLGLIEDCEIQCREADRRKLRYALEWAQRNVVDDRLLAAHWCEADMRDVEETIGGEGTPMVASECLPVFAAALGATLRAAMQLMADALDLRYRLPRLWRAVDDCEVAPWRARRIAAATRSLSAEAAAYVEEQVLEIADSCGPIKLDRIVNEAVAKFDTPAQAEVEAEAKSEWGVRLDHYVGPTWGGTSRLEILGDTPTLTRFHDLLCADAHAQLDAQVPADEQPTLGQRKVEALRHLLDGSGAQTATKLYVHMDIADLPDPLALGKVERLGPLTVATLKDWLDTSRFTLQPVLDLSRGDAVDAHDPPTWMRETVILRDRACAFPWCERNSRDCDLDHIEPYVEMDDGGPPGQTSLSNLAPLCRRHHRAKTFFGWSYRRDADGSYVWQSPHGRRFTVDPRGVVTRSIQ